MIRSTTRFHAFARRYWVGVVAVLFAPCSIASGEIQARLIGNAAIEISDGETVLLTDFPYTSGAYGYMTYAASELLPRPGSTCLITHSHADHFDPTLVSQVGCQVLADERVQESVPKNQRRAWSGPTLSLGNLTIKPISTPHLAGHNSYRVVWDGLVLYFTGDTESAVELTAQTGIDWLFITPWLAKRVGPAQLADVASHVVIYHRAAGETIEGCGGCLVPEQGESIVLERPGRTEDSTP